MLWILVNLEDWLGTSILLVLVKASVAPPLALLSCYISVGDKLTQLAMSHIAIIATEESPNLKTARNWTPANTAFSPHSAPPVSKHTQQPSAPPCKILRPTTRFWWISAGERERSSPFLSLNYQESNIFHSLPQRTGMTTTRGSQTWVASGLKWTEIWNTWQTTLKNENSSSI